MLDDSSNKRRDDNSTIPNGQRHRHRHRHRHHYRYYFLVMIVIFASFSIGTNLRFYYNNRNYYYDDDDTIPLRTIDRKSRSIVAMQELIPLSKQKPPAPVQWPHRSSFLRPTFHLQIVVRTAVYIVGLRNHATNSNHHHHGHHRPGFIFNICERPVGPI